MVVWPHGRAGFLEWLLPRWDMVSAWVPGVFAAWRQKFQSSGQHLRSPGAAANLAIGCELFVRFATDVGTMTDEEAKDFLQIVEGALSDLLRCQRADQEQTDPVRRFLQCMFELLSTKRAAIAPNASGPPDNGLPVLGWRVAGTDELYLFPEIAFREVVRSMREAAESMPLTKRTLLTRLRERGILHVEEASHNTVKRTWGPDGQQVRVAKLSWTAICDLLGIDPARAGRGTSDNVVRMRRFDRSGPAGATNRGRDARDAGREGNEPGERTT